MKQGFTLIELSIVLVIVGLIVGGVLVGRDLIAAAKQRAQISQIDKLIAATQTFRLKYNALPGDIKNAVDLGLGSSAALHNGNGGGVLDRYCFINIHHITYGYSKEAYNFFMHLSNAGLVEDSYTGYTVIASGTFWDLPEIYPRFPRGKIYNNTVVIPSQLNSACDSANHADGGQGFGLMAIDESNDGGNRYYDRLTITGTVAKEMDRKTDDGDIREGRVRMAAPTNTTLGAAKNDIGTCATVPPSAYPNCLYVRGMVWMNKF